MGGGASHAQPNKRARGSLGSLDRRGRRAFAGKIEQAAVRHDARRPPQSELALLGEIAVDLELREAPRIRGHMTRTAIDRVFAVTVVLLHTIPPQQAALAPLPLC